MHIVLCTLKIVEVCLGLSSESNMPQGISFIFTWSRLCSFFFLTNLEPYPLLFFISIHWFPINDSVYNVGKSVHIPANTMINVYKTQVAIVCLLGPPAVGLLDSPCSFKLAFISVLLSFFLLVNLFCWCCNLGPNDYLSHFFYTQTKKKKSNGT